MLPLALIPLVAQGATGLAQLIKSKKMGKENQRPDDQIPEEIKQNLSQAQMQAYEGLPASAKEQYIQNLQRSSQFGLNAMSDRKAGLTGLSSLVQNQNDAYNNLMVQDAVAKQNNLQQLMQQRDVMAQYKDNQFQMNKMQPFLDKAQAAQGLAGAGLQNLMGAITGGVGLGEQGQILNNLIGNNKMVNPELPNENNIEFPQMNQSEELKNRPEINYMGDGNNYLLNLLKKKQGLGSLYNKYAIR